MNKIKLKPQNSAIYNRFISSHKETDNPTELTSLYNFTWDIAEINDDINIKLTNTTDNTIEYNFTIPYSIIKNNESYDSQTLYALKDTFLDKFFIKSDEETKDNVETSQTDRSTKLIATVDDIFEITNYTLKNKLNMDTGLSQNINPQVQLLDLLDTTHKCINCVFKILVPYKDCPASELEFIINTPDTDKITSNFINQNPVTIIPKIGEISSDARRLAVFNLLTITADKQTPAAGDTIKLTITSENTNLPEVYVESRIGVVNKTKVKLTNGVGTVSVITVGLDTGDELLVKFGYRYFTGVANYTKTLA